TSAYTHRSAVDMVNSGILSRHILPFNHSCAECVGIQYVSLVGIKFPVRCLMAILHRQVQAKPFDKRAIGLIRQSAGYPAVPGAEMNRSLLGIVRVFIHTVEYFIVVA